MISLSDFFKHHHTSFAMFSLCSKFQGNVIFGFGVKENFENCRNLPEFFAISRDKNE